jgi:uncharacterized protein YgiM (DUF1202 family)
VFSGCTLSSARGVLLAWLCLVPFGHGAWAQTPSSAVPDVVEPPVEATPAVRITDEQPEPCPRKVRCVEIAEPYLEMHSGPGRGYPVFHVVGRGERIRVLKRRTDWFLVRTDRQIEGWASREQMLATLELTGEPLELNEPTRATYATRRVEGGAFAGRFGGASLISLFAGYGFTEHLTAELTVSNAIGNVTDSFLGTVGLNHTFAPEWWISPYAGLGTGAINTSTRATLVRTLDGTDQIAYAAVGARAYLARRFLVRFEYRSNVILTSRDDNQEIDEWKLGFAFFF